jgi:hypothetical protein
MIRESFDLVMVSTITPPHRTDDPLKASGVLITSLQGISLVTSCIT